MPDDLLSRGDLALDFSFGPNCKLSVPFTNHLFHQIGNRLAFEAREVAQPFRDFRFPDLDGCGHDDEQRIMNTRRTLAAP